MLKIVAPNPPPPEKKSPKLVAPKPERWEQKPQEGWRA